MTPDLPSKGRRSWPAGREPAEAERIETCCEQCGLEWWIHKRLASHRLRCECGAWVQVPGAEEDSSLPATRTSPVPRRQAQGALEVADYSRPARGDEVQREVATGTPVGENALRHATLDTRRRWKNRGVLELAGVIAAFWGPMLLFHTLVDDRAHLIYMPLTDLVSGVLILLVGLSAPHYTFSGLRPAATRFVAEAVPVALVMGGLAYLWSGYVTSWAGDEGNLMSELRAELGLLWSLVLIGVFPAIFEELGFRGLLQGRLSALYGRNGGILLQGIAFALAHGVTIGFPFHVFGGFYLGWLRARSRSLYPGMVVHLLYNATLVLSLSN